MTLQDQDYEDILRSALRTAAKSVEPAGDGLQKIRHRLNSPRSTRSMLGGVAGWAYLTWIRLSVRLEPVTEAGRSALGWVPHNFSAGTGPRRGRQHARARRPLVPGAAWLRPLLAVSAVVAIVVAGFIALRTVQQTVVTRTNSATTAAGGSSGQQAAPLLRLGPWLPPIGVNTSAPRTGKARKKGPASVLPAIACTPAPLPAASSSAPAGSATPTPAPVTTPSDTSPAQATPTPTDSGSPSATPSATDTTSGATSTATTAVELIPNGGGAVNLRCGTMVSTPKAVPSSS